MFLNSLLRHRRAVGIFDQFFGEHFYTIWEEHSDLGFFGITRKKIEKQSTHFFCPGLGPTDQQAHFNR